MRVGDFDRVRKLGKGGQASVQLWKSKKDGTLMAVKIFKDPNPACSEKFKVDGQLLEGLQHPCLVKVLYHILPEDRGEPVYLLREFVEGGALDPSILDATGKALILLSIARGIEYLHEQNIVHRDIKSTNVLVTPSGMGDFFGNWEVVGLRDSALRRVGTDTDKASYGCASRPH
jgi:serine/threonine protein kinase